jgi:hypothetical protein
MSVAVRAIQGDDLPAVGEFLHSHLNSRISAQAWAAAPVVPWQTPAPNYGFLLEDGNTLVGAMLAFYSIRTIDGVDEPFCNLGAWCVREDYRAHSIRMMKAVLDQKGFTLTDLSPSGTVVPLNERLKFQHLDTTTALIPGLPYPTLPGRIQISTDPADIQRKLTGGQLKIYLDHANAAAANHLLLTRENETCYVIYRRDRRKGLPVFASILYVGNPDLFAAAVPQLSRHLLFRHGILATLAELRVVTYRPRFSKLLSAPRRKMFKSSHLKPEQIDNLYSELVCVAW